MPIATDDQVFDRRFKALGGPCSVCVRGVDDRLAAEALAAAEAEVLRIETKFSRFRGQSIVSRINAASGRNTFLSVDSETASLIDYAATAYEQSDGLFDITSGVLRRVWDFKQGRVPSAAELSTVLPLIGWDKVRWTSPRICLPLPGMELDFGGFGKEYAADRVVSILRTHGVQQAMVDLGGDLAFASSQTGASPWRVGVRHPRHPETAAAMIEIVDGGIATSGDYERYFEIDGRRYCHILSPRTGMPVAALASVTVTGPQCLVAGTAATIAMLKGKDAIAWLSELGLPWLAVDENGECNGTIRAETEWQDRYGG